MGRRSIAGHRRRQRRGYSAADKRAVGRDLPVDTRSGMEVPGLEPAAGTVSEPRFERRTDAAGMAALLRVFIVPVFGFLTFFVALAIGVPWDRVGLLGLATLTGTLLITVVSVDR